MTTKIQDSILTHIVSASALIITAVLAVSAVALIFS